MTHLYIVIEGGCVKYVSATSEDVQVHVLDLDDRNAGDFVDQVVFDVALGCAEANPRVW